MKRRKDSFLIGLFQLPWWVNLALAVVVWLLSKWLDSNPSVAASTSALTHQIYVQVFLVASFFAQVFALLFLVAALVSTFRSWRMGALFRSQKSLQDIRNLSWQDFERYIGEAYRRKGYTVEETGVAGADGGIDLIAKKNGDVFLVQCKRWRDRKVGVRVARELFGLVKAHGAAGGILVTSGEFTEDAWKFARQTKLTMIDEKNLIPLIGSIDGASAAPADDGTPSTEHGIPNCPQCRSPMVKRTAKRGNYAGQAFWGCSRYPSCRGTREWASH